jgi:ADP-ribose pyrophosphatase YjhB (NUDIX family)
MMRFKFLVNSANSIVTIRNATRLLCSTSSASSSSASGLYIPLSYSELKYKSVEIVLNDSLLQTNDSTEFATRLFSTVQSLKEKQKNAIYLKVSSSMGHLIPLAAHVGFKFHHAEGDFATMLLWLGSGENKVPPFATHHVGVGAAVISDTKLLVVREKEKHAGINGWKLPGGLVNLNEEISAAASREVFEETGVKSRFEHILAFRHQLNWQFGRGDLYFVCKLAALSSAIKIDDEIEDAMWMEIEEFASETQYSLLKPVATFLLNKTETSGLCESSMSSTIPGRDPYKFYMIS